MIDLQEEILKRANLELAKRDFFHYCHVMMPKFFKYDRDYLRELTREMQDFLEGDDNVLVVNIPPRHGKSLTATKFVEWMLGNDIEKKVMTGSYNEKLSTNFAKAVRNTIMEVKADDNITVYNDVFPNTRIKRGDASNNLWSLEGAYNTYLATSPTGTATGFGASVIIVDDLIKNAYEASNANILEGHWEWFCFTGDTLVDTVGGKKKIEDIQIGDKVYSFNHSQLMIEEKEVVKKDSKMSPIYRLEFENGEVVECTGNHPFYTTEGYKSIEEILRSLQTTIKEGEVVLFEDLRKQSASGQRDDDTMFGVRKRNTDRKKKQTEEILFYKLQERAQEDRSKRQIRRMGGIERRTKKEVQDVPEMLFDKKTPRSPHRSQYEEQRFGESDSPMFIMPYRLSQITRLPRSDVRTVYDIEVKDNHNFFANDMLVHNCNTMISRLEDGGKIVVIMTRWHSGDLAGKVLKEMPEMGFRVKHVNMKAEQEDGSMLCEEILSKHDYELRKKALGSHIASANYQQEPIDLVGRLYGEFKTWDEFPKVTTGTKMYVDTADTGSDYLSGVVYESDKTDNVFVRDFVHTQDPMEITEELVAKKIVHHEVTECIIESNNGGRGFRRSVEKKVREMGYNRCKFVDLHQTKNKQARILSNATTVNELVHMPSNWKITHPEVYEFFSKYQRSGKNKHDDMADAITGVVEQLVKPKSKVVVGGKIHGRRR